MPDETDMVLGRSIPTWSTPTGTGEGVQILTPISAAGTIAYETDGFERGESLRDRSEPVLAVDLKQRTRLASQSPALARAALDVCAVTDEAPPYPGARVPGRRDWEQAQRRRRGR
jgi:hypothetical protein